MDFGLPTWRQNCKLPACQPASQLASLHHVESLGQGPVAEGAEGKWIVDIIKKMIMFDTFSCI